MILNPLVSQNFYTPNQKVLKTLENLGINSTSGISIKELSHIDKKQIDKIEIKINKCIFTDSNFALLYLIKANLKCSQLQYLGENGAFELYSKYLEKRLKYPFNHNFCSTDECCFDLRDNVDYDCIYKVKYARFLCFINAYKLHPDLFDKNAPTSDSIILQKIDQYVKIIEYDLSHLEKKKADNWYGGTGAPEKVEASHDNLINFYLIKAEFEYNSGNYKNAKESFEKIIGLIPNETGQAEKRKLIFDKMYELGKNHNDTSLMIYSLISYFKVNDYEINKKKVDFQIKKRDLINLINEINNVITTPSNTEFINGIEYYSDNKNIPIINYSSAIQFLRLYNPDGIMKTYLTEIEHRYSYYTLIQNIDYIYNIYKEFGANLGMVWPKYKPIEHDKKYLTEAGNIMIREMFNHNCMTKHVLHINEKYVYVPSAKSDDLTVRLNVSDNWRDMLQIPVAYLNNSGNTINSNIYVTCKEVYNKYFQIEQTNPNLTTTGSLAPTNDPDLFNDNINTNKNNVTDNINKENVTINNTNLNQPINQGGRQVERLPKRISGDNSTNSSLDNHADNKNENLSKSAGWAYLALALKVSEQQRRDKENRAKTYRNCLYCNIRFTGPGFYHSKSSDGNCKVYTYGDYHCAKCAVEGCKAGLSDK